MQVRAIAEAAAARAKKAGGDPRPEIMIPLVGAVQELERSARSREGARRGRPATGVDVDIPIGTMIELPRAR
jgi:pyruvate,orthophosphate dikinase